MTPEIQIRPFTGFTAAFAVAAALAAAPPAQSMPIDLRSPDAQATSGARAAQQAFGGSYRPIVPKNGKDHREPRRRPRRSEYYSSHQPSRTRSRALAVERRPAAATTSARSTRATPPPRPAGAVTRVARRARRRASGSGGFDWDDAAIGAGRDARPRARARGRRRGGQPPRTPATP